MYAIPSSCAKTAAGQPKTRKIYVNPNPSKQGKITAFTAKPGHVVQCKVRLFIILALSEMRQLLIFSGFAQEICGLQKA